MLKISYAGYLGLSPAISLQFTFELCLQPKTAKNSPKAPLVGVQGHSKSSMLIKLQSP